MAGFKKVYIFGGSGGFMGADGVNPIAMQIWVGVSDGKWFEAHYFDKSIKPISGIKSMIPKKSDEYFNLLESTIIFAPIFYEKCKTLAIVKSHFKRLSKKRIIMNTDEPEVWDDMTNEAQPIFDKLNIFQANIIGIDDNKNIKEDY